MQKIKIIALAIFLASGAFAQDPDTLVDDCAQESMEWLASNPQAWMEKACRVMEFKSMKDCLGALDSDEGPQLAQDMVDAMRDDCVKYYTNKRKQGA